MLAEPRQGQLVAAAISAQSLNSVKGWDLCVNSLKSLGEFFGIQSSQVKNSGEVWSLRCY